MNEKNCWFFFYLSFYKQIKFITFAVVVFKQDIDTVNVKDSTKIHFPPRRRIWRISSYVIRPHTTCSVSINCITGSIILAWVNR